MTPAEIVLRFAFDLGEEDPERTAEAVIALDSAIRLEREACAKAVDALATRYQRQHDARAERVADECAAAIRARSDE